MTRLKFGNIWKTFSVISNKKILICGDYNIDLINPNKHSSTDDFINRMYSMSLYPTITRPSRFTSHSAILMTIFLQTIWSL